MIWLIVNRRSWNGRTACSWGSTFVAAHSIRCLIRNLAHDIPLSAKSGRFLSLSFTHAVAETIGGNDEE